MGSVWLSLRADLRGRWRPLAALALLLGLIGGVVLTAAAGARRTDTAYPRLLQWAGASQVDIVPGANGPTPGYFGALRRLPQVAAMSVDALYQMVLPVPRGLPVTAVMTYSSPDGSMGVAADRVKILVCWQASALAAAGLLAGLPLGLLAGRWAWALFAGSAGVSAQADVPVPLILLTIPAALLLANLLAAGPGWAAARIRPGRTLRSE